MKGNRFKSAILIILCVLTFLALVPATALGAQGDTYVQTDSLQDGQEYLIVVNNNGIYYAFISQVSEGNGVQVTVDNGTITWGDTDLSNAVWTVTVNNNGQYALKNGSNYAGATFTESGNNWWPTISANLSISANPYYWNLPSGQNDFSTTYTYDTLWWQTTETYYLRYSRTNNTFNVTQDEGTAYSFYVKQSATSDFEFSIERDLSIKEGETGQLHPTFTPQEAATIVNWHSDDESIATVNSSGIVTGIKEGATTITATAGGKTKICEVAVTGVTKYQIVMDNTYALAGALGDPTSRTYRRTVNGRNVTDRGIAGTNNYNAETKDTLWIITEAPDGGYYIKSQDGRYLSASRSGSGNNNNPYTYTLQLSTSPHVWTIDGSIDLEHEIQATRFYSATAQASLNHQGTNNNNVFTVGTGNQTPDVAVYHAVTFNYHSGNGVLIVRVKDGDPVSTVTAPEYQCHEFDKWVKSGSTVAYDFSTPVTEDFDLHATYTETHVWGEPTYVWAGDNKTCRATRTCSVCGEEETELVVASVATTDPTCEAAGKTTYTATFESDAFETQTQEVAGDPATGHDWDYDNIVWNWNGYTCPTATLTCTRDNTHTLDVNATVTGPENGVYTAAITGPDGNTYTDIKYVAHNHDDIEFTPWTATDSLPATAGSYYLTADVTLRAPWDLTEGTVNLCLDGHTISMGGANYISIDSGETLNLYDSSENDGKITGGDNLTIVNISTGGTFKMYGGSITEKAAGSLSLASVIINGEFHMHGGSITNNNAFGVLIYPSAKLYVSGSAVISGNGTTSEGSTASHNVMLYGPDGKIIVEGELTEDALIGVYLNDASSASNPINVTCDAPYAFTSGLRGRGSISNFTSDNGYQLRINASGEAEAYVAHTLTATEAHDATCTEAGNSAYWTCSMCGKYFSDANGENEIGADSWVIAALGHDLVHHDAQAATCTTAGNSEYYTCSVCGKYFSDANGENEIGADSWVIAALGHDLVHHDAQAATCTTAGNSEYYTCSRCGKYFSDASGENEITENSWVIASEGHSYTGPEWIWTGNDDDGYTAAVATFTCSKCGDEQKPEVTFTVTDGEGAYVGYNIYTASTTFEGESYSDVKRVIKKLTVTFNMNGHGEQIPSQTVTYGETATKPVNPSAEGWVFDWYYTDEAFTAEFSFNWQITQDTVLYVKWTEKPTATITFADTETTYDGKEQRPDITVKTGTSTYNWVNPWSFRVKYYSDENCTEAGFLGWDRQYKNQSGVPADGPFFRPVDAGTYYVKVDVGDTDTYYGNSAVAQFTIAKRSLVINPTASEATYNGNPQNVDGYTVGGDGLADGEWIFRIGSSEKKTDVGTYTWVCYKSAIVTNGNSNHTTDNYDITYAEGTLTINPAPLTVITASANKPYDGTPLTAGGSIEGFMTPSFGEHAGQMETVTFKVTGSQTEVGSSPNTYTITWNGTAKESNYIITEESESLGTLTVTKVTENNATVSIEGWTYGDESNQPSTTATAGASTATYQYKVKGAADDTYSNTKPTDAGEYTLQATIAESDGYVGATATTDFTIAPKAATVKANDAGKTYGGTDPELTAAEDGVVDGDTLNYTLSRAAGENVGEYAITVTLGENPNYDITPANGTFTISKAELTVTAKPKTITYGDAPANDGVTYATFVGEDSESDLSGELVYTYTYEQYGNIGTYKITPSGLTSVNYNITYAEGDLTVEAKEVGLSWGETSFTYDGSSHAPTANATGLVNDDTCDVTVTGAQTNAGTYTATASGLSNANYKLPAEETTTEFTIKAVLEKIEITTDPDKTEYKVGDKFNPTGMVVTAIYNDGTTKDVTDEVTISPNGALKKSDDTITVSYSEDDFTAEATVPITVKSKPNDGSGNTPYSYDITIDDTENGDVQADKDMAVEGSTVTITPASYNGYEVDTVTVTDSKGNDIPVTDNGDGTYSFTMPARPVTVDVTFKEADGGNDDGREPDCPSAQYKDVDPNAWYHSSVDYAIANGLMNGVASDEFAPNGVLSRAMLVTILYRAEGEPEVSGENPYTDVAEGTWYSDAVAWADANGIVKGFGDGTFGPNENITREQIAAIMMRYADYKGIDTSARADLSGYADADDISDWAYENMQWANAEGLITGRSNNMLVPQGNTTRAETAAILMRFCEKYGI